MQTAQRVRNYWVFGLLIAGLLAACSSGAARVTASPAQTATQEAEVATVPPVDCQITPADMEGPYYLQSPPFREDIRGGAAGEQLILSGVVYAQDCITPLVGAVVDIWQADANGVYDFSDQFVLRGRVETDSQGRYQFITVTPGYYGEGNNVRPLHIHLKASYGDSVNLTTQIYFEGDRYAAGVDPALLTPFSQSATGWEMVFNIILRTG